VAIRISWGRSNMHPVVRRALFCAGSYAGTPLGQSGQLVCVCLCVCVCVCVINGFKEVWRLPRAVVECYGKEMIETRSRLLAFVVTGQRLNIRACWVK